jgi:hypothetical protein
MINESFEVLEQHQSFNVSFVSKFDCSTQNFKPLNQTLCFQLLLQCVLDGIRNLYMALLLFVYLF